MQAQIQTQVQMCRYVVCILHIQVSFHTRRSLLQASFQVHMRRYFVDVKQPPHIIHLICTATHCNTLQHTATHCNTLQHISYISYVANSLHMLYISYVGNGAHVQVFPTYEVHTQVFPTHMHHFLCRYICRKYPRICPISCVGIFCIYMYFLHMVFPTYVRQMYMCRNGSHRCGAAVDTHQQAP